MNDCNAMRQEVWLFAAAMEKRLQANDHKGGWREEPVEFLFRRLKDEVRELELELRAYEPINRRRVLHEAADVANFAMMIADVCQALKETAP